MAIATTQAVMQWVTEWQRMPLWVWLAYVVGRLLWVLCVEDWCWLLRWRWKSWRLHRQHRRKMRVYQRELQRAVNADLRKRGLIQ